MKITDKIGLVHQNDICSRLYKAHQVRNVLDLGAGNNPQEAICRQIGVRQLLIDLGYPESDSEWVIRRKIDITDFSKIRAFIKDFSKSDKVDCVVSIGNIEHLEKAQGEKLLDEVEDWATKLVIFETPNGFVHQGPEEGNPYQVHLSGWTPSEFRKKGYKVIGTTGLKILKKNSDQGAYRLQIRGMRLLDVFLSRALFIKYFPSQCFNFIAYKILD